MKTSVSETEGHLQDGRQQQGFDQEDASAENLSLLLVELLVSGDALMSECVSDINELIARF